MAQIAGEALKLTILGLDTQVTREAKPKAECTPLIPMKVSTYLDPTAEPNTSFSQAYITTTSLEHTPLSVAIKALYETSNMTPGYLEVTSVTSSSTSADKKSYFKPDYSLDTPGVLFRSLMLYSITVTADPNAKMKDGKPWCLASQVRTFTVMAPNDGHVYSVDVSRTALVEKKTNLTIVDGILTRIDVTKPSSLIAGAKVPLDILKAITSVLTDFLTLRIQRIQDEGSVTKAKADAIQNDIQLLKNEILLQQQRNSAAEK